MLRRDLVKLGAGLSLLGTGWTARAQTPPPEPHAHPDAPKATAFSEDTVRDMARNLARAAYSPPPQSLPAPLSSLSFEQYRGITYNEDKALWRGQNLAFEVEFFPRGFLYRPRIEMHEVVDGHASAVPYDPDLFNYADPLLRTTDDVGFGGLRLRYAINTPGVMEEFAVFLGASYFRAIAKGQTYGLSARGFSNGTGDPRGEEFAQFRAFWLEKPTPGADSLVVHALLDSPSVTGAFRFTIRPGEATVFDVQSSLFPRQDMAGAGLAPLTGMFYFDTNDHTRVNDWRPAAHDSEALQIWTGTAQQLYRPLANPTDLQFSAFADDGPQGFGLMQRKRAFTDYQDLVLNYEKRPSAWIEPIGHWGKGAIDLVEIPTPNEVNDNIVTFWRPERPLKAGQQYDYTYRITWGWDTPAPTHLARIEATRIGSAEGSDNAQLFVIDFTGEPFANCPPDAHFHLLPQATQGTIRNVVVEANPPIHGWRAMFEFDPGDAKTAELQVQLANDQGPISEKWMYRWTP